MKAQDAASNTPFQSDCVY